MPGNPYEDLPPEAFWRTAVANRTIFDLSGLWRPRFGMDTADPVVTFGSCFAQHIGRALRERGFAWFDAEQAPDGLSAGNARRFNYGIFSARTANIYTTSLLLQWTRWAMDIAAPPSEYWEDGGRIFDPFRPKIETNGFSSVSEMSRSRKRAIASFSDCIRSARHFVFTLGLTESWWNRQGGYEYPLCPGTAGGSFDAALHRFDNQDFGFVAEQLTAAMDLMKQANPQLKFLLTVSPVPLTATMSGKHVLVATQHSKAILRAVAGQLAAARADTDYFPSYEIITSAVARSMFYESNLRQVTSHGVDQVMRHFFSGLGLSGGAMAAAQQPDADVNCEEELLDAFGTP